MSRARTANGVWAPHALAIHRLYYNVGVYTKKFEPWVDEVKARADFTLDRLAPGRFLYGNAGRGVDTLQDWGEITGADYVALRHASPRRAVTRGDARGDPPLRRRRHPAHQLTAPTSTRRTEWSPRTSSTRWWEHVPRREFTVDPYFNWLTCDCVLAPELATVASAHPLMVYMATQAGWV